MLVMVALPKVVLTNCYSLVVAIVATLLFMAFIVVSILMKLLVERTRSNIVMGRSFLSSTGCLATAVRSAGLLANSRLMRR